MKKIFVLLLIVAAFAFVVPGSRERVMNWLDPLGSVGQQRSAERAMEEIAAKVRREAAETGAFPATGSLAAWLERRSRSLVESGRGVVPRSTDEWRAPVQH